MDPIDHRCISRFIRAFSKTYKEVVTIIIKNSAMLDREVFRFNLATLMTSFKMTRRGAFHGVRIDKQGIVSDPKGVIELCWKQVGVELRDLRSYINEKASGSRKRVLADLSPTSLDYVIEKTSDLFEELRKITVETSEVSRVGASKVLFAILPEVALPVDNQEWRCVFKTEDYQEVLSTMVNEIKSWERKSGINLETSDPEGTLPGIYNVMAMAARRLS